MDWHLWSTIWADVFQSPLYTDNNLALTCSGKWGECNIICVCQCNSVKAWIEVDIWVTKPHFHTSSADLLSNLPVSLRQQLGSLHDFFCRTTGRKKHDHIFSHRWTAKIFFKFPYVFHKCKSISGSHVDAEQM